MFRSSLMPAAGTRRASARRPRPRRLPQGRKPLSHGRKFRQLLTANWRPPDAATAANVEEVARRLDGIPLPGGTGLLVDQPSGNIVSVRWENCGTQHCIRLDVDLARMEADYEYSMVCEERDRLKPFPARPLGSGMTERTGLNLRQQRHWTWLSARIQATARPLPA